MDKSQVSYRKIKSVDLDTLKDELSNSHLCQNSHCLMLNDLINCYNETLSSALDRHAPLITKTVVKRPTVPWFDDDVKSAKRLRRKAEKKWRRTKSHNDFLQYKSMKNSTTFIMNSARNKFYTDLISENSCDHLKLFKVAKTLFNQKTELIFPHYQDSSVLANDIGTFFMQKIERILFELDATVDPTQSVETAPAASIPCFDSFELLSEENVRLLISKSI